MSESSALPIFRLRIRSVPRGIIFLFLLLFVLPEESVAQKSKVQLEKEKTRNLRRIAETNKILKETASEKQASLGQLTAINQQISTRAELINAMSSELRLVNQEIHELNQITFAMENDLAKLRKEYAAMVYAASKASNGYNKLVFLFSSGTFNQLVMRLKYLEQYSAARKIQVKQIEIIRNVLAGQRTEMDGKKREKNQLLQSQVQENRTLLALKDRQDRVVSQLSVREKELQEDLEASQKAVNRLEKLISDLIEEEIKRSNKNSESVAIKLTPEAASISASFEESKTKLTWPVKSGFISSKFGKQPHPVLKGIIIDNLGVGIQTSKGEEARAVYDGVVLSVASMPGMNKVVAIQHGDYITVYAKLSKVVVKAGQQIKSKQPIGEVFTDEDGTSELQFQIWKNFDRLNPQAWLFNK